MSTFHRSGHWRSHHQDARYQSRNDGRQDRLSKSGPYYRRPSINPSHYNQPGKHQSQSAKAAVQEHQGNPSSPTRPHVELLSLVEKKSFKERASTFRTFKIEEQLVACGFQPPSYHTHPLPTIFPAEYLQTDTELPSKIQAAETAKDATLKAFDVKDEEDEDEEDEDFDEDFGIRAYEEPAYVEVIKALPYCLPVQGEKQCWCPCSKYQRGWKDFFGMTNNSSLEDGVEYCGSSGGKWKTRKGLIQHLTAKRADPIHFATLKYIGKLYTRNK
jgi:hypothetical protein